MLMICFTDVDLQLNLGFRSDKIVFTDVGFYLKSGFKKVLCSQMLVFALILDSRKYFVHQFFLYQNIHVNPGKLAEDGCEALIEPREGITDLAAVHWLCFSA